MPILARKREGAQTLALLAKAGENAVECAGTLATLIAGFPERRDLIPRMKELETEGDRLTHKVIVQLQVGGPHSGLPADAGFALATTLDDVVDNAEQTAEMMGIYGIEAPMEQAVALSEVLTAAAEQVSFALVALRDDEPMKDHLVEINRLENEGDRLHREALAALFGDGVDPMVVIRWKDIFGWLEASIDACERVAHQLEGVSLRQGRQP